MNKEVLDLRIENHGGGMSVGVAPIVKKDCFKMWSKCKKPKLRGSI